MDLQQFTINTNDSLLFNLIQASDSKVFEYIYHKYFGLLCRYAYGFTLDQSLSEDMVNDSFLELWEKRTQIRINTSLKAYLLISVRNKSLNLIKRKKIERNYQSEQIYLQELDRDITEQLDKFIQLEELELRLNKAIEELPPQCREIFRLNRFNQLSYQEIADQLNLSVFTVKTQISRALKSLRKEFEHVQLILFYYFSKK
ncbi:MAG: RNA polymerase sigma-70 factor [Prolixibacteraceae bacterium]